MTGPTSGSRRAETGHRCRPEIASGRSPPGQWLGGLAAIPTVTRRDFLKVGVASAGALAATGLGFDLAVAESTKVKQNLRIAGAKESHSVCPYCAVGCSLVAYTRQNTDGTVQLLQIEGDPDSPVNEGRLCPKRATAMQRATST